MSEVTVTTAYVETPVFYPAGDETLFGIVTRPRDADPHTGFIILPGGGTPLTTNRNRLSVRICRELATRGFLAMRCDYHGTGESTGSVDQFRLDQPFVDDVSAAIACLIGMGVERVLLAGSCFGGRTALATAAAVQQVDAVMLLATSPRDYVMGERVSAKKAATWSVGRYIIEALRPRTLRGLFDRRLRRAYMLHARAKARMMAGKLPGGERRLTERPMGTDTVSPHFERHLQTLVERGVPVLLLFGTEDGFHEEFRTAAAGPLAGILESGQGAIQIRTVPGKLHGFASIAIQDAAFDEVVAWAAEHRAPGTPNLDASPREGEQA